MLSCCVSFCINNNNNPIPIPIPMPVPSPVPVPICRPRLGGAQTTAARAGVMGAVRRRENMVGVNMVLAQSIQF